MEKLINKESVLEVAKGFTFTDKTEERQYMDFLEYCLDNTKDNSKPLTNAERIRNMTDEELAEFLCNYDACVMCSHNSDNMCTTRNCDEIGITERWLKSEIEEE